MKKRITLIALSLFSPLAAAQSIALSDCRAIADVNSRVACYDAIVDAQTLVNSARPAAVAVVPPTPVVALDPAPQSVAPVAAVAAAPAPAAPVAAAAAPVPAAQPATAPQARLDQETMENLFGAQGEDADRIIAADLGVVPLDQIEAVVTDVNQTAYGKLILTLDNGHTWQQLDTDRLRVREGDEVIVRSGSMNSFLLEKATGSRTIRVRRNL